MTASKKQMKITIGPYENIQQEMLRKKSDLSVGLDRITKGTAFNESYYRKICVTQDSNIRCFLKNSTLLNVGIPRWKNSNIRCFLNYEGLWSKQNGF